MADTETAPSAVDDRITCHIDGARVHSIQIHLREHHPDWTLDLYRERYPGEPVLSKLAEEKLRARQKMAAATDGTADKSTSMKPFHEVFELGRVAGALNGHGNPIMIRVFEGHNRDGEQFIPDVDKNYVFNIDLTKNVLMALEVNMPVLLWGYHGTGKTTCIEQACARTKRPFMRVQHTVNTEESHILGQWTVKDGSTVFELGPLPLAMLNGWVYCADEYDRAMPGVLSAYQPVMEGKALFIKEAPAEMRMIRPHPNFRFTATGNTNGSGDETGLYQSTLIQDTSNYSRFQLIDQVDYMPAKIETVVVANQSGIRREDAEKIVKFATELRSGFKAGRIGTTVSPRELIAAAKIGAMRSDYRVGLRLAFINRLSRVDKEVVEQFAQRIFGGASA